MDIEKVLEGLSLNKGNLDKESILKLQKTLAEACRIHDPAGADELSSVLERMRLRSEGGAAPAAAAEAGPSFDFAFTSPERRTGGGKSASADWSPTPLGADGERSAERG